MKKGKFIEKTSFLVSILAAVATIAVTVYEFKYGFGKIMLSSIAALIFFLSYGVHDYTKKNNQQDKQ